MRIEQDIEFANGMLGIVEEGFDSVDNLFESTEDVIEKQYDYVQ